MVESLLRVREAAQILNVSQRTIWRMLDDGELTRIRVGGKLVRVERAELDAIISSQRKAGSADAR
jgi:excisionase family DNA binding protein